jgi:hypothetical protein
MRRIQVWFDRHRHRVGCINQLCDGNGSAWVSEPAPSPEGAEDRPAFCSRRSRLHHAPDRLRLAQRKTSPKSKVKTSTIIGPGDVQ